MSDLVRRLRDAADGKCYDDPWWDGPEDLLREATDSIERMATALQEIERLATDAMPPESYGIGLRGPVRQAARRGLGKPE